MADSFDVNVPNVGAFVCRRNTIRTSAARFAEFARLTEGLSPIPPEFEGICNFLSYLRVMIIRGPDGWDPYALDADDESTWATLSTVYEAVKAAEARFRAGAGGQPQGAGEGTKQQP